MSPATRARRTQPPPPPPAYSVLLSAAHPVSGFVGSKPDAWTRWVLDLLGYQPGDKVDDLFPGSGAVTRAMDVLL